MSKEIQRAFEVKGMKVPTDANGFTSLTGIWIAAGRPKAKDPARWLKTDTSKEFVASVTDTQKSVSVRVVKGGKEGTQGTWGHFQVALAYAKWLSPEIHQYVNEGFRQWQEEDKNPALKIERGVSKYRQLGFGDEWIGERLEGIITRKALTSTMADHNCKNNGPNDNPFAEGTRSICLAVLGKTPKEIRVEKALKKSDRVRDSLDEYALVRIRFAESEAKRLIQEEAADGNGPCVGACRRAGHAVKVAIQSLASPTE